MKLLYIIIILTLLIVACSSNGRSGDSTIVDPIEYTATFPGGADSLKAFVRRNLVQPENKDTGKVFVAFIVNKDGIISDISVVRGLNEVCDKSAIEVIQKMPQWIPATQINVPVRQRVVLPIQFE